MATAAQKAYARGTITALNRKEERKTSLLKIDHSPAVDGLTLLSASKHTFDASGAAARYRISVSLVEEQPDLLEALRQSEERNALLVARLEKAEQQLSELKNGAGSRWISLQECADLKGLHYSTIWRAHKDNRLVTRQIGGNIKEQVLCDPTTYRPLRKGKKKQSD